MLTNALFLAALNKALVDALVAPLRAKFPDIDTWWLVYVALVTGFALGWISDVNIFTEYIPHEITAKVLSSLMVGLGSNLLHQVFDSGVDFIKSRSK